MATTVVSNQSYPTGFSVSLNSDDLRGCEELVAAPGAGKAIEVDTVTISVGAAMDATLGAGESSSAVETVLIGPIYLAANSTVAVPLAKPIRLAMNKSLTADASAAGNVTVHVTGRVV